MSKNIFIICEDIYNIPLNSILDIKEIVDFSCDINNYKIKNCIINNYTNCKDLENSLNLQLKHRQWHQKLKIIFTNENKKLDFFYIDFYNSFTRKKYFYDSPNFYLTNYNLNYENGINQYLNSKFYMSICKTENNILEINEKNNENIEKYFNENKNIIKNITNPFYFNYINNIIENNEKINLIKIENK